MSKKILLVIASLLVVLCLGCQRSHNVTGPTSDRATGNLFGSANLFYGLGFSDVYFTDSGLICLGQFIPWSEVRVGSSANFAGDNTSARGDVAAATAGPTKDHPWGGDAYASIEGAGAPLYCSDAGRFVILATSVGPGGKYYYIRFVGGNADGMYALIDPVVLHYYHCGIFDPFNSNFICKGGSF